MFVQTTILPEIFEPLLNLCGFVSWRSKSKCPLLPQTHSPPLRKPKGGGAYCCRTSHCFPFPPMGVLRAVTCHKKGPPTRRMSSHRSDLFSPWVDRGFNKDGSSTQPFDRTGSCPFATSVTGGGGKRPTLPSSASQEGELVEPYLDKLRFHPACLIHNMSYYLHNTIIYMI